MDVALEKRQKPGGLEKYDPDAGLKRVAVAEAAELHYRRAKDTDNLVKAVEAKLTEQRNFVLWWEANADKRGRKKLISDRKSIRPAHDGMPDALTIHRWRSRLKDEGRFSEALELATEKCIRACEWKGNAHVSENSGENEWYTPPQYIEAAVKVMGGIDLDPASSDAANKIVQAKTYYTIKDNGLEQEWAGRVWMNPPYAAELVGKFTERLALFYRNGSVSEAIVLVNNATETDWFYTLIFEASAVVFPRARIKFIDKKGEESGAPLQGQAFIYLGKKHTGQFLSVFSPFGWGAVLP